MASSSQTVRVGLTVGFIGFAAVAVFYAVFDVFAARGALYTVDLLGKSVFQGLRDPSVLGLPIQLDMTAILMYTALHLIVSLAIGLIVAGNCRLLGTATISSAHGPHRGGCGVCCHDRCGWHADD